MNTSSLSLYNITQHYVWKLRTFFHVSLCCCDNSVNVVILCVKKITVYIYGRSRGSYIAMHGAVLRMHAYYTRRMQALWGEPERASRTLAVIVA